MVYALRDEVQELKQVNVCLGCFTMDHGGGMLMLPE